MNGLDQALQTQARLQAGAPQLAKLKDSCQGLEAGFLKSLVSEMRKGAGDVHFGEELGGDSYREMFDDTLANLLAKNQGAGMADAMFKPLAQQVLAQTARQKTSAPTTTEEQNP